MGRGERRCRGPSAMVIYDVRRWRATIISALSVSVVAPDADAIGCSQSQLTIEGERRGEWGRSISVKIIMRVVWQKCNGDGADRCIDGDADNDGGSRSRVCWQGRGSTSTSRRPKRPIAASGISGGDGCAGIGSVIWRRRRNLSRRVHLCYGRWVGQLMIGFWLSRYTSLLLVACCLLSVS